MCTDIIRLGSLAKAGAAFVLSSIIPWRRTHIAWEVVEWPAGHGHVLRVNPPGGWAPEVVRVQPLGQLHDALRVEFAPALVECVQLHDGGE
jgi:hypothetical protein